MGTLIAFRSKNFYAGKLSIINNGVLITAICRGHVRRYQFLAFDFDETVDMTMDNCRLLLLRLKMEGWMMGKTKVFLKYYSEEYLARYSVTDSSKSTASSLLIIMLFL